MDEQTKQLFENLVQRIVEKRLGEITRSTQSVIGIGIIKTIDYNGQTATVELINGGITGAIPYPKSFTSSTIGVGQRVLVGGPDPNNANSMFIISAYGNF